MQRERCPAVCQAARQAASPTFQPRRNHRVSGCWEASLPWLETRGCPQGELPIQRFPDDNNHVIHGLPGTALNALYYAFIDINQLIERAWNSSWFSVRTTYVFITSTDAPVTQSSEPPGEVSTFRSSVIHTGKLRHGEVPCPRSQLLSSRVGIQTQGVWLQNPCP